MKKKSILQNNKKASGSILLFAFLAVVVLSTSAAIALKAGFRLKSKADGIQNSYGKSTAWWPVELGNWWVFSVTELDKEAVKKWDANFIGNQGSIGPGQHGCTDPEFNWVDDVVGSKVAMEVMPSSGYNRFNTTRYVQFYKESAGAYHAPKYCGLLPESPEGWNLQWYMHNPVYYGNNWWQGSEGGIRYERVALDGRTTDPSNLITNTEFASLGKFPKTLEFLNGAGRYPQIEQSGNGLPGYSYIPLYKKPNQRNTANEVVPDFSYDFAMGYNPRNSDFRHYQSNYLNAVSDKPLRWDLEFVPLKARDVLSNPVIAPDTSVLGILVFEPAGASLSVGNEIACEAYYLAKDIGPVKMTHSIVAVMPNDPDLAITRQLCFSLFKSDFQHSLRREDHNISFSALVPYQTEIDKMSYNYPRNTFELLQYKRYSNPQSDKLGYHTPAASFNNFPEANTQEYFSNGRFWVYKANGDLWAEGNLQSTWEPKNVQGLVDPDGSDVMVYPWSKSGPQAVTNSQDIQNLLGAKGIVINQGVYWLRDSGDQNPFAKAPGYIKDIFPGYYELFGNDTARLGITTTGNNQIFLEKDGTYLYYRKNQSGGLEIYLQGRNADLDKWQLAPTISTNKPFYPDGMMYGNLFSSAYYDPNSMCQPLGSEKQLIIFQKGAAWVKYDYTGDWETWENQVK